MLIKQSNLLENNLKKTKWKIRGYAKNQYQKHDNSKREKLYYERNKKKYIMKEIRKKLRICMKSI